MYGKPQQLGIFQKKILKLNESFLAFFFFQQHYKVFYYAFNAKMSLKLF